MDNKNNINIKTGEKHFDIPKSGAVDLRAKNMGREKDGQYNNKNTASDDGKEFKISEEKNTAENPARENVFKSFLKKHTLRQAQGDNENDAREIESTDSTPLTPLKRGISSMEPTTLGGVFDKAIAALLYFLVFALPLFILPLSMEIYEFNKTLLLFIISSLAFLLWITKMILIDKRLAFVRTPLDMPIIVFISLVLVSTAFSVDKISSILGFYGRFSDSLLVYLSLAMLYFVVVNVATRRDEAAPRLYGAITNNLIKAFLASAFIIAIAGLFYFFGFKFIPWQETQFRSFNLTSGSLNVFGIYLVAVILIALHYCNQAANILSRNLMLALIAIALILLAIIDFIFAWIALAVSLVVVLVLGVANKAILKDRHSEGAVVTEESQNDAQGIELRDPIAPLQDDRKNTLLFPILIFLVSIIFIATSLTFINKDVESNFFSSAISTSIKNRIVVVDDNQTVSGDGFSREVILDKNTAVSVVIKSVKQDPIAGVIGSGPGTYLYNFSKFKPAEFNNNAFWNIRFDKAGSEILEKVSTIGILGTLSYLLIAFFVIVMFLKTVLWTRANNKNVILRMDDEESRATRAELSQRDPSTPPPAGGSAQDDSMVAGYNSVYLFAAWFALLLFQFMYLEATTTKFIFWLLTAILVAEYVAAKRFHSPNGTMEPTFILDLKKEKSSFYSSLLVLIILLLSFASAYYYQFKFYQAEAGYKKVVLRQNEALAKSGLSAEQIWEVLNKNTDELKEVIAKNPHCGTYRVYLSDIYLNRMNLIFQEESRKNENERDNQRIAEEAKNTIDYAKSASDSNPNNIIFQHKIADVYMTASRDIGIVGADEWAVKKYRKAIELEPTNPVLRVSFGKIYMLHYAATESAESIDQAISEFEKALELKENYIDAGLQLGIAYENMGNNQKAINILNSMGSIQRIESVISVGQIVTSQSVDIDIAFQLGRLYYNTEKISKAKDIFVKIIKVNPSNSNARYSLGLIYEKEKNYKNALSEFEAVLLANPENEDVKGKIEEFKKIIDRKTKPVSTPKTEPEEESESESGEIEEEE